MIVQLPANWGGPVVGRSVCAAISGERCAPRSATFSLNSSGEAQIGNSNRDQIDELTKDTGRCYCCCLRGGWRVPATASSAPRLPPLKTNSIPKMPVPRDLTQIKREVAILLAHLSGVATKSPLHLGPPAALEVPLPAHACVVSLAMLWGSQFECQQQFANKMVIASTSIVGKVSALLNYPDADFCAAQPALSPRN